MSPCIHKNDDTALSFPLRKESFIALGGFDLPFLQVISLLLVEMMKKERLDVILTFQAYEILNNPL
jgi:hypothetical protein